MGQTEGKDQGRNLMKILNETSYTSVSKFWVTLGESFQLQCQVGENRNLLRK